MSSPLHQAISSLADPNSSALVVFSDTTLVLPEAFQAWDLELGGLVASVLAAGDFRGRADECLLIYAPQLPVRRIALAGLGTPDRTNLEGLRRAAGIAARALQEAEVTAAVYHLPTGLRATREDGDAAPADLAAAVGEGARLAVFEFVRASKALLEPKPRLTVFEWVGEPLHHAAHQAGWTRAAQIVTAIDHARRLILRPGGDLTPAVFADEASRLAGEAGLRVAVMDEQELASRGFNGIVAIGRGSEQPPRLITLHHEGGEPGVPPIAIVGKGVTFDSGGIGIKPSRGMEKMKYDMAGGAAALAIVLAAAYLRLPVNLVAVIPSVENMPSDRALCPNEVLTMYGGLTAEINDTDAEGRVILADALAYAAKDLGARAIVDMATLTGAVAIALGRTICGVMGTESAMTAALIRSGRLAGDPGWELPLNEPRFDDMVKSDIADLVNYPGGEASSITAASFMKPFTFGKPWVHLDIAGVGWSNKVDGYRIKGPTGAPIRMVLHWLQAGAPGA
ncbi:MAG: leucyl aminopeptidase family protein [Candidatus Sericytochromatia bacterium]|nr:leucyl aminopeptidase family protein [Candidatus Sericytochromatia bacterium]